MSLPVKKLENAIDYLVTEVYRESPPDMVLDAPKGNRHEKDARVCTPVNSTAVILMLIRDYYTEIVNKSSSE